MRRTLKGEGERMIRSIVCRTSALLVILATVAGLNVAVAAGPGAGPAAASVIHQGFEVVNQTLFPVRFVGVSEAPSGSFIAPPYGAVVQPGQVFHFELEALSSASNDAKTFFSQTDSGGHSYVVEMLVPALTNAKGQASVSCRPSPDGVCFPEVRESGSIVTLERALKHGKGDGQGGD